MAVGNGKHVDPAADTAIFKADTLLDVDHRDVRCFVLRQTSPPVHPRAAAGDSAAISCFWGLRLTVAPPTLLPRSLPPPLKRDRPATLYPPFNLPGYHHGSRTDMKSKGAVVHEEGEPEHTRMPEPTRRQSAPHFPPTQPVRAVRPPAHQSTLAPDTSHLLTLLCCPQSVASTARTTPARSLAWTRQHNQVCWAAFPLGSSPVVIIFS